MRQSTIDTALKCLPATKPQLAERLQVTPGRAQQIVTELLRLKLVKPLGVVMNGAGGLVQRFVPADYQETSEDLLNITPEQEGQPS